MAAYMLYMQPYMQHTYMAAGFMSLAISLGFFFLTDQIIKNQEWDPKHIKISDLITIRHLALGEKHLNLFAKDL